MKRIYILIASVISLIAISVRASAYEPTVREDRVWEYYSEYFSSVTMEVNQAWASFKFDGTADVNGKTYHKWVKFEEVRKKVVRIFDHSLNLSFLQPDIYFLTSVSGIFDNS